MRVLVKENRPGSGAIDSHPHAAIVSVIARPAIGAALAAEQQSSKRRTSDFAFSNTIWMADHSRVAYVRSRLLDSFSQCSRKPVTTDHDQVDCLRRLIVACPP